MSVIVTLHVFSGRPDPSWELSLGQADKLADLLRQARSRTLLKPPGLLGQLGYRGFTIYAVGERQLERQTYVHAGIADVGRFDLSLDLGSSDVERFLLDSAGSAVDEELQAVVRRELDNHGFTEEYRTRFLSSAPPFDPGKWNNDSAVQAQNNCYNYANDKITNTFAQPGRGSGTVFSFFDCAEIKRASERDGEIPILNANISPADGFLACLVVWAGKDFHWYRRDENGLWSHKPGITPARNTDNSGHLISDPATCDMNPYSLCGYYNCIPEQVNIL